MPTGEHITPMRRLSPLLVLHTLDEAAELRRTAVAQWSRMPPSSARARGVCSGVSFAVCRSALSAGAVGGRESGGALPDAKQLDVADMT